MPRLQAGIPFALLALALVQSPAAASEAQASAAGFQTRFGIAVGALAVVDLAIRPTAFPLALDSTLVGGSSVGWRLGLATPPMAWSMFAGSLFCGLASKLEGCTGVCPAMVYDTPFPTAPESLAIGARAWLRIESWSIALSPSAVLAFPSSTRMRSGWLDDTLKAQVLGQLPPPLEVAYQVTPNLAFAFRTSFAPFGLIASF